MSSIVPVKPKPETSISNIIEPHADGYITVTLAQFNLLKELNLLQQIGTIQNGNEFVAFYARETYGIPTTRQALMYRCYLINPDLRYSSGQVAPTP